MGCGKKGKRAIPWRIAMFRFSIRELMLLTLAVGLSAGWWLDHKATTARYAASHMQAERFRRTLLHAKDQYEKLEGFVFQLATNPRSGGLSYLSTGVDWSVLEEPAGADASN
jgi:hypothetical protein